MNTHKIIGNKITKNWVVTSGTSDKRFSIQEGLGPQSSSLTNNNKWQWLDKPRKWALCIHLGHIKHQSNDKWNLSIRLIDVPFLLYQVKERQQRRRSTNEFFFNEPIKRNHNILARLYRVERLSDRDRTALKSPQIHTFFPRNLCKRIDKASHNTCFAPLSQGAYTLHKKNSSFERIKWPWIITTCSKLTVDQTSTKEHSHIINKPPNAPTEGRYEKEWDVPPHRGTQHNITH